MPKTRGTDTKTLVIACCGAILGVGILLVAYPTMKTAWGVGPEEIDRNARSIGRALGVTGESSLDQRILRIATGPVWLNTLNTGDNEARVAVSPAGDLLGACVDVHPLSVHLEETDGSELLGSFVRRFLAETHGWQSVDERPTEVVDENSEPFSFEFTGDDAPAGVAITSGSLTRVPDPSYTLLPWLHTSIASLALIVLSIPLVWRRVKELKAAPGSCHIAGIVAGCWSAVAALFWLLPRFSTIPGIVIAVFFGVTAGCIVLMGVFLRDDTSRERISANSDGNPIMRSWLLGLSFLMISALLLLLPDVAIGSLDRFVSSPVPWVTAFLFAGSIGMVSEWGIRPIIRRLLPERAPWMSLTIPAVILALWVPYAPTGLWVWDRLSMFLIGLGAGLTVRSVGMIPNAIVPYIFLLGFSLFPGFAAGIGHVIPSALFLIGGLAVVPPVLTRRTALDEDTDIDAAPEYVRELERSIEQSFSTRFIHKIQPGLCRVDPPEKSGLQLGMAIRRSEKPTSAICRVFSLGRKRMGVFLAEVPGEEMESAFHAVDVMAMIEAVATLKQNPASVMSELSRLLRSPYRTNGGEYRLNYSIIDERSNSVSIITAGHSPVIIYRPLVKKFEEFSADQPAVRVDSDESGKQDFGTATAQLISHDLVIFHSTCLLDESNPSDSMGRKHIYDIVDANPSDSCSELADRMQNTLDSFYSDKDQPNDIITLFIRNG